MIRGSNFGASAAVDDVRLPFSMNATVTYGDPPPRGPLPDPLPPGWVRIPVSFQVMLPVEIMQQPAACGGSSSASAGTPGATVSIVPHSLRLGTEPGQDGDRTWQDFGALFDALHDGSASPAFYPVDGDELIAAERRDPHPVLPIPAPLAFDKAPAAPDFDAFLDFMGDPDRHPAMAPPAPTAHGPGPGKSASAAATGETGIGRSVSGHLGVLPKVTAAGEIGLGAVMTTAGAGEILLGVATAPAGVGIPIAAEGVVTTGAGIGLYEDGLRQWNHGGEAAVTPHVDPRPPSPPLVPPVMPPPTGGFSTDPKAARPHGLVTTPVQPGPRNEGLVVEPPQGPAVVTIYGDEKPDVINDHQKKHHRDGGKGYIEGRSWITHPDPQALLNAYKGTGTPYDKTPRGQPGFSEFFDTGGEVIGIHRDRDTGIETPTTRGRIHYNKLGAHIVPAPPQPPEARDQTQ